MNKTRTSRGFDRITFKDTYDVSCCILKSLIATDDRIWFGVENVEPKIMAKDAPGHGIDGGVGTGWVPYPIPPQVLLSSMMYLSRKQVKKLLPVLERFVKTGNIV